MAAYGLYTHIAANKTRSMVLLASLFLLVYVIVYAGALIIEVVNYAGAPADYYLRAALRDLVRSLPFSTGAVALWIVIAYFFHQKIIDAVTGGTDVTRREQPRLYNLLENLCISRGIPMPKLKIVDSEALNAYATGLNPKQYAVTVTTGLLNALNDREMEAAPSGEQDGQTDQPDSGQQPRPLPSGPWNDAGNQGGSAPTHSPWGNPAGNPTGNPTGPWGPH